MPQMTGKIAFRQNEIKSQVQTALVPSRCPLLALRSVVAELEDTYGEDIFIIHLVRVKNARMVASGRTACASRIAYTHLTCLWLLWFCSYSVVNRGCLSGTKWLLHVAVTSGVCEACVHVKLVSLDLHDFFALDSRCWYHFILFDWKFSDMTCCVIWLVLKMKSSKSCLAS